MPFLPLLLMPMLLGAADPTPGPIKAFGDWVVACDNQHRCEMTSLVPGDGTEAEPDYEQISFSVEREAGPAAGFVVEVQMPEDQDGSEVSIRIDSEIVTGKIPKNGIIRFTGADAAKIVAAMVKGKELNIADIADTMIGRVSLTGSSAALRFIDADQGRAGTVTAAVAKGTKPASAVPGAMAGPVIRFVRPAGIPAKITPVLRKAMEATTECAEVYAGGEGEPPAVAAYALGGGKTLALLPCGSGAYNFSTVPFIVTAGKPVLAAFDFPPGMTIAEDGEPTLVNAGWDAKTGRLSSYSKGRGVGDCGASEDYVWDGTRFRLVEARSMIECRGSVNWLTVYRAGALAQ
jgi:hypothetical protein